MGSKRILVRELDFKTDGKHSFLRFVGQFAFYFDFRIFLKGRDLSKFGPNFGNFYGRLFFEHKILCITENVDILIGF